MISIPDSWKKLDPKKLAGLTLIIGAPDTGKSTLARYLYDLLNQHSAPVAFLDGDPGQSVLGPPTTMTLGMNMEKIVFSPKIIFRYFVSAVSPIGHMLDVLTGAARLIEKANLLGARSILYDTTGLVNPAIGGLYLKLAKIDLLRPQTVIAIQNNEELSPLLVPLQKRRRLCVITLEPSDHISPRDFETRKKYRADQFRSYFSKAKALQINWSNYAVLPRTRFRVNGLLSFEDEEGFSLGLGIIKSVNQLSKILSVETPLESVDSIDALRLGDLTVDPHTFEDTQLPKK